jgi:hypothetical protein
VLNSSHTLSVVGTIRIHPSFALRLRHHIFIVRYVRQDDTKLIVISLVYRRSFGQKDAIITLDTTLDT